MYIKYGKRVCDLIISFVILPFYFLLLIFIHLYIYMEDKGSLLYKSNRLGYQGRVFTIYKIRTMKENAPDIRNEDGSAFNSETDPRTTSVGRFLRKTSLDELPQILNVIKGDMSFIGPRPDLPDALQIYKDNEKEKLNVKPGITGYNQAFYRNSVDQSEKFKNDRYYVNNISLKLDLKILIFTFFSVIRKENISYKDTKE